MTSRTATVRVARDDELPVLARLMASAPLLIRYRTTYDSALTALSAAHAAGDALLAGRLGSQVTAISGLAWLSFAPRLLNGAAYLRLLLVAEEALGHGLGSVMLDSVEHIARERANHLYLLVTVDNAPARAFYERRAYQHVGDLAGLAWPDLNEALYHKALREHGERLMA